MSIAIIAPKKDVSIWSNGIKALDNNLSVQIWPDIPDPDAVQCVVVWNHPKGILRTFRNLKLICSMGAGVDHILSDDSLPAGVSITKIVEDKLTFSMSNFVAMAVLNFHRRFYEYQEQKAAKIWDQVSRNEIEVSVGILGMGTLGQESAHKLQMLGLPVYGLSRSRKDLPGVTSYIEAEMDEFLGKINVLVCLLPYTPENHGILNYGLFRRMNRGSYLINAARGKHQIEDDIIRALDEGLLAGAFLDVFQTEPLPAASPIWGHPKIQFTPHVASITSPEGAIPQIVNNYKRLLSGEKLIHLINRSQGY